MTEVIYSSEGNVLSSDLTADGSKNFTVLVTGRLVKDLPMTEIVWLDKLNPKPGACKLEALLWLVQEKAGLLLWWEEGKLIAPLESRNSVRLDLGWNSPRSDWSRTLSLSSFGVVEPLPKHFTLVLDFDKQ
jgi:hypothetical protein